jgi:mannose-6-phosphate isomerase-like protein (cupin superfamily)
MFPEVKKAGVESEFETRERCFIIDIANDENDAQMSIARARVEPGVTTEWHRLIGTTERYIIASGSGLVEVQGLTPTEVSAGDVVLIPADTPQRIKNSGDVDLVFYCVCTPQFRPECYEAVNA